METLNWFPLWHMTPTIVNLFLYENVLWLRISRKPGSNSPVAYSQMDCAFLND